MDARFDEHTSAELMAVCQSIEALLDPKTRGVALAELPKYRDNTEDLACYLWYSFGTTAALLSEIVTAYPYLNPPTISQAQCQRVCGSLTLLQMIASHPETKPQFMKAQILLYLYPFLNSPSGSNKHIEFMRLTALGVIGALVRGEDREVLQFLMNSEAVPLCLRIMEFCDDFPQTVATFIMQKILTYNEGLEFICETPEKFFSVTSVLGRMVINENNTLSPRLFRHILRCYLRLAEHKSARESLSTAIPGKLLSALKNNSYTSLIDADPQTRPLLETLVSLL